MQDFLENVWRSVLERSNVWAARIAREAIKRAGEDGIIILRSGTTPSGMMHIGNANEALRNYLVCVAIKTLGGKFVFLYSLDEMDPFPKVPRFVQDKCGNKVPVDDNLKSKLERYLGFPFYKVPDPYGCHPNYAEHFTAFYLEDLKSLGIRVIDADKESIREGELAIFFYRKSIQYRSKEAREMIRTVLQNAKDVVEVLKKYKERYRYNYPANVVCRRCGRILGEIIKFDGKIVKYRCVSRTMKNREIKGCGFEEEAPFDDVEIKLPWTLEWTLLDWFYWIKKYGKAVIVEPMGKDHYLGSLPPAKDMLPVLSKILGINVSENNFIWYMYEMFLVDGQKMSGSKGNVYLIRDLLKIWEREIVAYFYAKNILKQLNIDLKNAYLVVNEFDMLERRVFDLINKIRNKEICVDDLKDSEIDALATYYLSMFGDIPERPPRKLSYTEAATIGYFYKGDVDKIRNLLNRMGLEEWEVEKNVERIIKAKYWLENYAPQEIRDRLIIRIPEKVEKIELNDIERKIFEEVVDYLEKLDVWDPERIYNDICGIVNKYLPPAKENKKARREVFSKMYRALIGKDSGPKIGTLVFTIGKESINLLKRHIK